MKIKVSNEIFLYDVPSQISDWIKKNLVVDNPDYIKKQRLAKWTGNTPRKLYLYKVDGNTIIAPVGALKDILALVRFYKIEVEVSEDLAHNATIDYGADVNLYEYQGVAVDEMIKRGYGILKSKAGSGKTQMGIAIAVKLKSKTLWLTHTQDLLKQSYDRAAQYIDKSLLGKITAGKVEIGVGITFATVQTLAKQDISQYKYEWDTVIVDECHRCSGGPTISTQFGNVISKLAARHKFGLSATVHRADGLIKTTFSLLGNVAYTVPDEAIADKVMDVRVVKEDTHFDEITEECLDTDGTLVWSKMINALCEDRARNEIIVDKLVDNVDNYNLILSDRISHLLTIVSMLPETIQKDCTVIDGKTKKDKREQAIEDVRDGRKHYLFASYRLAKEGLDIPRLDRLHLVTPQKDYAVITQCIGRIARTLEGKQEPICYDYVDEISIFESMWRKRKGIYKKGGCIV